MQSRDNTTVWLVVLSMVLPVRAAFPQSGAPTAGRITDSPDAAKDATAMQDLLRQDSRLQRKVTLSVTGRPLREALADLSKGSDVDLEATRSLAEQRVTICVVDLPMWQVMVHLSGLLEHSPTSPKGYYYWERQKGAAAQQPDFKLLRGNGALWDERHAREFP